MSKSIVLFKKISTRELTAIGLLIALTMVLGYISGFLRIGNISKFSISFISVFVAAAAFGPVIGGFVGAAADFMSYVVNPTGPYLWQLTLIEFAYGFLFGLLFYRNVNEEDRLSFLWYRIVLCVLLQFAVNMIAKTFVLVSVGLIPASFGAAVSVRAPGCIVMAVLQILLLGVFNRYMPRFLKMIRKNQVNGYERQ